MAINIPGGNLFDELDASRDFQEELAEFELSLSGLDDGLRYELLEQFKSQRMRGLSFPDSEHPLKPNDLTRECLVSERLLSAINGEVNKTSYEDVYRRIYGKDSKKNHNGARALRDMSKRPSKLEAAEVIAICNETGATLDYLRGKVDRRDEHESILDASAVCELYEQLQPHYQEQVSRFIRSAIVEQLIENDIADTGGAITLEQKHLLIQAKAHDFLRLCTSAGLAQSLLAKQQDELKKT